MEGVIPGAVVGALIAVLVSAAIDRINANACAEFKEVDKCVQVWQPVE